MASSWIIVNKYGKRFMNETAFEPCITNARMTAPGNIAWTIWDSNYMENYKSQEPDKFQALPDNTEELVEECVANGRRLAEPGDTVLLSPASASWDMYKSFEQRGDHFRNIVNGLK